MQGAPLPGAPGICRQSRQGIGRATKKVLNPQGGIGAKGGYTPTLLVGANPTAPLVPGAPPSRWPIYWQLSLQLFE